MQTALGRLEGVKRVAASIKLQALRVDLEPGVAFSPRAIKEAVALAEVTIERFLVVARGRLEERDGRLFLIAGADRFLVLESAQAPTGKTLTFIAEINDLAEPMEARISRWEPVQSSERE